MTASADQQVLADRPLLGRRVIGLAEGSGEGSSPGHQHPPVGKQSGRRVARANALQVSGPHELSPDRVEALAQRCGVSRERSSAVDPSTDEEKRTRTERDWDGELPVERAQGEHRPRGERLGRGVEALGATRIGQVDGLGRVAPITSALPSARPIATCPFRATGGSARRRIR